MSSFLTVFVLLATLSAVSCQVSFHHVPGRIPSSPSLPKPPDVQFAECCKKIPLKEKTVDDACHYFPSPLSAEEKLELGKHWNPYIGCYANHKNNRQCCIDNGVVGPDYERCQIFCDGTQQYPPPTPDLYICETIAIKMAISGCNKKSYGLQLINVPGRIFHSLEEPLQ